MLRSLPVTVIVLLLASSCSTYQYGTVSSAMMPMNEKQEFIYENDSLRLVYNFNGPNAPVNITVQNKLQVPLYIDWKKSAVIINDRAVSYVPSEMRIEGGVQGSSYNTGTRTNGTTFGSGSIDATVSLPPAIDFVPPRSFFTRNPIGLTDRHIENVPESDFHRVKYQAAEGHQLRVKSAEFTEENSPLRFKSYLTLMVGDVSGKNGIVRTFLLSFPADCYRSATGHYMVECTEPGQPVLYFPNVVFRGCGRCCIWYYDGCVDIGFGR